MRLQHHRTNFPILVVKNLVSGETIAGQNSTACFEFLKISKSKCHWFAYVRGTFPRRTVGKLAFVLVYVYV